MPSLPGDPRRDRASRSGRCGQSRCSRRMAIGRWRGAFRIDGCRRGPRGWRGPGRTARRRGRLHGAGWPASSSVRRRQASRAPPSAYRISRSVRRPGGPWRLRATVTALRWPTTSRPSRIQPVRSSSSRRPLASSTAAARARPSALGSTTTSSVPARLASAASRPSRSPTRAPADRRVAAVGQVDDEEVHGPGREERGREREGLLEVDGGEHHEPFRADAAGDGLDGIEGAGEVEPGDDRARRPGPRRPGAARGWSCPTRRPRAARRWRSAAARPCRGWRRGPRTRWGRRGPRRPGRAARGGAGTPAPRWAAGRARAAGARPPGRDRPGRPAASARGRGRHRP